MEFVADSSQFARDAMAHAQSLYSTALRMIRNRADAEDLVQETYLKAFRSLGEFRGESSLLTWLTRIATASSPWRRRWALRSACSGRSPATWR